MNLILDSHALIWMTTCSERLSPKAIEAVTNSNNVLFVSAASYWEICLKIGLGKLDMGKNWKTLINRHISLNDMQWLPIRKEHAQGICTLPKIHKDPFDRMLIAQAKWEKMAIVTADRLVQKYPVKWIW